MEGNPDIKADVRVLPFNEFHADVVMAVHVIEHFYLWEVQDILAEWKRVLKVGGTLILELPCMDKIVQYMARQLEANESFDIQMTWLALWGHPGHKRVEMCHKWGYTKEQIKAELMLAGFMDVEVVAPLYHVAARDMRVIARRGK